MRIMALGAGAVGGYFAGRLAEAGADVTFLVREPRKQRLLDGGLTIRSRFGDWSGPVNAITAAEVSGPFDVLILTCKAYDLASAIDAIRPAVGPRTAILPLLNGLAHIEVLNAAFGRQCVLGGLAKIAVTLTPDGAIQHLNDWRYLTFGEQDGARSARVLALKAAFDRTTVLATVTVDVMQAMWEKIVHLTTAAGMTCLMRANVGEVVRADGGAQLLKRLLETNAEIAAAEGHRPSEAFMAEYRGVFSDSGSAYSASMLRDIERGGPIEADHILGYMLAKARAHGLDDTLHTIAYTHLKAYEERRAAQRL
jgi:2-dehydropantoate 2-reductase